jgi:hypothetical protein
MCRRATGSLLKYYGLKIEAIRCSVLMHHNCLILILLLYRLNAANAWLSAVPPLSVFAKPVKWPSCYLQLAAAKKITIDDNEDVENNKEKKNQLLPRRKRKLRTWDESFLLLHEYKLTNGDCNVPRQYKPDPPLGTWVVYQRVISDRLSAAQRNALNSLGFDWDPCKTRWNEQYHKLVEYKQRYGNCNVPTKWKHDPSLANWVCTQRLSRKQLSNAQRKALDSLNFDWNPHETAWNEQYQKIIAYKQRFGHCRVPESWKEDPSLAAWIYRIRHKKDTMSHERQAKLNDVGFEWDPCETAWTENFQKVIAYKQRFGDCNVPTKWKEDPSLGIWVQGQRAPCLDEGRRKALEGIGFDWDPLGTVWMDYYQRLKQYKSTFGDCEVPKRWEQDPSLAGWVSAQRNYYKEKCLSADRQASLELLGFTWMIRPGSNSHSIVQELLWQSKYYGKLLPFFYTHGHCRIPDSYKADMLLGYWARRQRSLFNRGTLRMDRMALLDGIGFVYNLTDKRRSNHLDESSSRNVL